MSDFPTCPQLDKQSDYSDCALIAIQNYTGKSRLEIEQAVSAHKYWSMELILERGTPLPVIEHILDYFGYNWSVSKARRGQWKLSGIAVWHRPGKAHATALLNGVVLDTKHSYCTIPQYREKYEWSLKQVYNFQVGCRG